VRRMAAPLSLCAALVAAATVVPASAAPKSASAGPALGIRHVFVIVLENESYSASYETNPNPYLSKVLPAQGTLLTQYFGIGHESNPNYLAMVSGQAPNPTTQSDCQDYVDFEPAPAVFDPRGNGQAVGVGCVYPSNVPTIGDQLAAQHLTWHGYMEDMGNTITREPAHCGAPTSSAGTGMRDGTQSATATDQYAARHNPFVYFHSLIDSGSCHANVAPLYRLIDDLTTVATTPNFSFITPNLCDDGHDAPCTGTDISGSNAGGLTSIDHFLSVWVPRIEASPAFQKDGLLIITTDEAASSDAGSCCGEQPGPDSPLPGVEGAGGGRTGTVVIGRCVGAGRQDATPYNHYSLLRSIEDLFGVRTGGSDGKGHLGYAGASDLAPFGADLFSSCQKG
jgi:phosphatidylinositol-3-phosphatase